MMRTVKTTGNLPAIIAFIATIFLIVAWEESYPLHPMGSQPLVFSISPLYWLAFLLLAVSLSWIASRNVTSGLVTWIAAVGFFTLIHSIGYYYFTFPGPDPFFRNLASDYLRSGFIDLTVADRYQWPGFFLLTDMFIEVTGLSQNMFSFLYVFLSGILLSSSMFVIARRSELNPFWAVVAYTLTGYYFLNYQFAPQTLGLVFVMLLIQLDYSKRAGPQMTSLKVILITATAVFHAFIGALYLAYLVIRAFSDRSYIRTAAITASIMVLVDVFLTASAFPSIASGTLSSILTLLGLSQYLGRLSATVQLTSPFQQFSRLAVFAPAVVSAVGLVAAFMKRRLLLQNRAVVVSSILLVGMGFGISLIGTRSLQLAIVAAGIGAGFFPQFLSRRRLLVVILLFLTLTSVFPVLHLNYSPFLYQTEDEVNAAAFTSSHIGASAFDTVYGSAMVAGFFPRSNMYFPSDTNFTTVQYALSFASVREALAAYKETYPGPVQDLLLQGNLVMNYGDGAVYTALNQTVAAG
jgi:hypothetical protein